MRRCLKQPETVQLFPKNVHETVSLLRKTIFAFQPGSPEQIHALSPPRPAFSGKNEKNIDNEQRSSVHSLQIPDVWRLDDINLREKNGRRQESYNGCFKTYPHILASSSGDSGGSPLRPLLFASRSSKDYQEVTNGKTQICVCLQTRRVRNGLIQLDGCRIAASACLENKHSVQPGLSSPMAVLPPYSRCVL